MEEKLFSIIVPVYNVEKYLNQCVDSLLNQTYKNFEVVLVDDGSPDNSPAICDEYAKKDTRVKVIHKKNGGLSDARNEGVKNASGKYLLFVDSDDYYGDTEFLSKLSENIFKYNSDLVGFTFRTFINQTGEFYGDGIRDFDEKYLNSGITKAEALKNLIVNDKLQISAWSYAIRKDVFVNNNLFFEWAMRMLLVCDKITFINAVGISYRQGRVGSITASIKEKNINDLLYIIDKYTKKFLPVKNEIEELLLNYVAYQYAIVCGLLSRIKDKKFKQETIKKLKSYKFLLSYNLNPKVRKVEKVSKVLGVTNTIKLLQIYLKYRGR